MKRILPVIALIFTLFFASCTPEGRLFEQHQELSPNVEWLQKDARTFEVPVADNSVPYNVSISFRYANGYQWQVAKIKVTETSPSGKETVSNVELKVREDNGDYVGEAGFDIWDSEHLVMPGKQFEETGTYTYKLEHDMPADPLNFAMEIGMVLDQVK